MRLKPPLPPKLEKSFNTNPKGGTAILGIRMDPGFSIGKPRYVPVREALQSARTPAYPVETNAPSRKHPAHTRSTSQLQWALLGERLMVGSPTKSYKKSSRKEKTETMDPLVALQILCRFPFTWRPIPSIAKLCRFDECRVLLKWGPLVRGLLFALPARGQPTKHGTSNLPRVCLFVRFYVRSWP